MADEYGPTIRKISAAGVVTTIAGKAYESGCNDGTGSAARFIRPCGIAIDKAGNLYVTDSEAHTLRKITPAGVVSTLAGTPGVQGASNGTGAAAKLSSPAHIGIDATTSFMWLTGTIAPFAR